MGKSEQHQKSQEPKRTLRKLKRFGQILAETAKKVIGRYFRRKDYKKDRKETVEDIDAM